MSLDDLRDALQEQAHAFFASNPSQLEHANVRLSRVLNALRERTGGLSVQEQASLRQMLRTQSEMLTNASAVNRVALRALDLPVFPYPPAGTYPASDYDLSVRRSRTHIQA